MKKFLISYLLITLLLLIPVGGLTYAAFTDKVKVTGSSFSMGSADIKLLKEVSGGTSAENLLEEKSGPIFTSISSNWAQEYLIKIYNNSSNPVDITSAANYVTINDPDDLRSVIYVEPFEWNDVNNNGSVDTGERGISYGRKTIVKWKLEGYNLGQLVGGGIKPLILKFSTDTLSDTKQGKNAVFDFEFSSIGL